MKPAAGTLPAFDVMYGAVVERDPAFDGVFFTCVRTTGVFCRPTCHARTPRRGSVRFVATAAEARLAGYRPCRVCRPLDPPAAHPAWALDLMSEARTSEVRLTDERLRAMGVNPGRVRRYFRRRLGATFQAFQRSVRLGAALQRLGGGQDPLGAGLDSGYESSNGFRAAFSGQFGLPPGRAGQRPEPARHRHPLPSGGAGRRDALRIRRGPLAQALAPGSRAAVPAAGRWRGRS